MKNILRFLVAFTLIAISTCRNTQCQSWNRGQEWRCAKDNATEDIIRIISTCNGCNVHYKIGVWKSQCGRPGVNEFNRSDIVGGTEPKQYFFPQALSGICREFFIFDCVANDERHSCLDVLKVVSTPAD